MPGVTSVCFLSTPFGTSVSAFLACRNRCPIVPFLPRLYSARCFQLVARAFQKEHGLEESKVLRLAEKLRKQVEVELENKRVQEEVLALSPLQVIERCVVVLQSFHDRPDGLDPNTLTALDGVAKLQSELDATTARLKDVEASVSDARAAAARAQVSGAVCLLCHRLVERVCLLSVVGSPTSTTHRIV